MIHRLIAAGAALGIVLPPVVLAARQIGEDASTAAQQATAAPATSRPATTSGRAQRTPAPIFANPLPHEPQPWSPDDGPLFPSTAPSTDAAPRATDRPAPTAGPVRSDAGGPGPVPAAEGEPTGAAPAPSPVEPAPEPAPEQPEPDRTVALAVPELVDRARIEAGCLPIGTDPELQRYAEEHAVAQAEAGEMSHSDGPRAENVAVGPESAAEVVEAWLTDEESRASILDCDAVWHGVGAARGADGVLYWTQVFRP